MSLATVGTDEFAKVIAGYVNYGLRVVRLHGLRQPGECTCWKRGDCGSPGKHPTGSSWEMTTDEDTVFAWWGSEMRHNVGVVLGNAGGGLGTAVIDIEADSEDAEAELQRLGLDRFETPTWSSGRGLHRLFLWTSALPDKAVIKPRGIEVRIGGGGKMAQSVIPPSIHHSGRAYSWLPGFGLEDVPIAAIPDNVMEVILEAANQRDLSVLADTGVDRRSTAILRTPVREGARNDSLFRCARLIVRSIDPGDEEMELVGLDLLRAVNANRCIPPVSDTEVKSTYRSALKYRREDLAGEALFPGVEAVVEGSRTIYRPAGLELTIHQGDPTIFELRCEALRSFNSTGAIRVPADVWCDARKMKAAIIAAFPGVPIDRYPGDFARIWDGTAPRVATKNHASRERVTGLRVLLEQEAVAKGRRVEVTDPAEHSTRRLVALLVETLDKWGDYTGMRCDDENATESQIIITQCGQRGGWVGNKLGFLWESVWRNLGISYRFERGDPSKVARVIPEIIGRKLEQRRVQYLGVRRVYRFLTEHELELLRAYGAGMPAGANGGTECAYGEANASPDAEKGVAGVAREEEIQK